MNGTVIGTFVENGQVCLAVAVVEAGGCVEYIGRVPLEALAGLSNTQKKTKLVEAAKAVRDAQTLTEAAAPTITGSVIL